MPRFEPFPGLRYATDDGKLDHVVAPPYDVISPEDQAALEARSDRNSVRVELPVDDPPRSRYDVAAALLAEWLADGTLAVDQPSFYAYRMSYPDEAGQPQHTVGVIGALGLEVPGEGDVLPHERTTPKALDDRLQLLRATRTNLSPVWGLSMSSGLSTLIKQSTSAAAAATDEDGVVHELWPITAPEQISAITAAVGSAPVVIADGHHRYQTGLAFEAEGGDGLIMAYVVELADEQLSVRAIHRLLSGLPDGFDLAAALAPFFSITDTGPVDETIGRRMLEAGGPVLVTPGRVQLLVPQAGALDGAEHDLDSSRLELALAGLPPHQLTYQHGWDLAAAAVEKGEADAAVLLRPATVEQIAEVGRQRDRMPPKTTFFWPKPRTGLVFRQVR